jgi:hypothetical protein
MEQPQVTEQSAPIENVAEPDARAGLLNAEIGGQSSESVESSWLDSIQDQSLRDSKSLQNFKDIEGLAKSYVHLEKKLGQPKAEEPISITPQDYTFDLPENYTPNENIINPIKEKAAELGIKPDQFKSLVETFTNQEADILRGMEEQKQAQANELKENLRKEWGNDFEDKIRKADETLQKFTSAEDDAILESMSSDAKLAIAKMMYNISSKIGETSIGKAPESPLLTKEQAQSKIDSILSDDNHPYFKGDPKAIEEFFELNKLITEDPGVVF